MVSESSPVTKLDHDQESATASDGEVSDVIHDDNAAPPPAAGTMRAGEAGSVDSADQREWRIQEGLDVIGTCGHKVGEVMDVEGDYVVVEQGFFICHDLYVPKTAIAGLDKHGLHLNLSKHQVDDAGWENEPSADTP